MNGASVRLRRLQIWSVHVVFCLSDLDAHTKNTKNGSRLAARLGDTV